MSMNAPADWTPGRMAFMLPSVLESYVLAHSPGYDAAAAALAAETEALGEPGVMMLGKEQFALFRFLCGLLGCRRALDVGTFTGMSALAFALGVGPEGKVVTIDRSAAWLPIARRHWQAAGVAARIEAREGEAVDVLRDLVAARAAPFDIAFIDVDKARVAQYVDLTLSLLAPRGVVIVDNVLWHGWVLDATKQDADTQGMRDFTRAVTSDARLEVVVVPIADGMSLIRRVEAAASAR
jgi:caffeoyl-CoA O-methyltransferase